MFGYPFNLILAATTIDANQVADRSNHGYPFDLILAVATASATIFLGFLPTKNIRPGFFAREALIAAFAWAFVTFSSPLQISHFLMPLAFFCGGAWWKFRGDAMLNGKMWLSLASGLGISVAVTLILILSPNGYPPGLPKHLEMLLLASVYLGGAVIGLAYVCLTLILNVSTNSGITQDVARRYLKILFGLTLVRAAVLLALYYLPRAGGRLYPGGETYTSTAPGVSERVHYFFDIALVEQGASAIGGNLFTGAMVLLGLVVLVLPVLSFAALHASRLASRVQPTRILVVLLFVATVAEIIARLLVI